MLVHPQIHLRHIASTGFQDPVSLSLIDFQAQLHP